VVGKKLAAARATLASRNCRAGKVRYARSSKRKGVVTSQSRRPGRVLPVDAKINLVVSRGRK
jgi:beta-lactam-binding protein with PASTA domain